MGTLFQSKPSSLSDRLPRDGDDVRTPEFAVPYDQSVQTIERRETVEPVRETTTYVAHDHGSMSGWIVTFLVLIVAIGLGFMSLMDLSSQQNKTEREVFQLRQALHELQLAKTEPAAIPPAQVAPVQVGEESNQVVTKEDIIEKTFPSLPPTSETTPPPTELPPPPTAVTPTEPVYGPQPAPAPAPAN